MRRRVHQTIFPTAPAAALGLALLTGASVPVEEEFERLFRGAAPTAEEVAWRAIDWHPNLASGLEVAVKEDRPVLLWLMNGNPAGFC